LIVAHDGGGSLTSGSANSGGKRLAF